MKSLPLAVCLALVMAGGLSVAAQPPRPLDPADGVVDGRRAVAVFPVEPGGSLADPLALEDCRVHLTSWSEVGAEDPPPVGSSTVYPCSEWVLPPPEDLYLTWIEGDGRMSSAVHRLHYRGLETDLGGRFKAVPVSAAGRVTWPSGSALPKGSHLRLFRAASAYPMDSLSREEPLTALAEGVRMPAGPVVAGVWDAQSERYSMLSGPFRVGAGETAEIPVRSPGARADVLVRLRRAEYARPDEARAVELSLVRKGLALGPELTVVDPYTVLAAWYDVPPGPIELRAESRTQGLATRLLEPAAGEVVSVEGHLRLRPNLDVELRVPPELGDEAGEGMTLEIRRMPADEVVAVQEIEPGSRLRRFTGLPLAAHRVVLDTVVGAYELPVDLTDLADGEDARLVFEPPVVALTGVVTVGEAGRPARLDFHAVDRTTTTVATDDRGAFEVLLPELPRSVEIALDDRDGPPWVEFFPYPVAASGRLDFPLSPGETRVRVTDADGRPVPGARVVFRNTFTGRDEREQLTAQMAVADETGEVLLPPLRPGELELRAVTPDGDEGAEPVRVVVADPAADRTVEVTLSSGETTAGTR